jgi:hypothetical protein
MTRKRYIPYKHEVFGIFMYTLEKVKAGDWDQEKIAGASKEFLKHEAGYEPPGDLAEKLEQIVKYIGRRIFKYPGPALGGREGKKAHKKTGGYDYAYKHYILAILLNFKYRMGDGFFNFNDYRKTVDKNLKMSGHEDYKLTGFNGDLLDNIINVYKKRIFEYGKTKREGDWHHAGKISG